MVHVVCSDCTYGPYFYEIAGGLSVRELLFHFGPDKDHFCNTLFQFCSTLVPVKDQSGTKVSPQRGRLQLRKRDLALKAYCNDDYLGCSYRRRSRTRYFLLLGRTPISWKSKKQFVVSRSSVEAEYGAMASTVSEVLWVRWLLSELRIDTSSPTLLFCDNQAARHIATNPVFHERTKHVEMDCYFVRERVDSKEIVPMHISSKLQIADLLTKGLTAHQLQLLLGKISIINLHANLEAECRI
nr:hypothetical protein [Tanacetum cinerariifolium]